MKRAYCHCIYGLMQATNFASGVALFFYDVFERTTFKLFNMLPDNYEDEKEN